jgi:hypothetical protein
MFTELFQVSLEQDAQENFTDVTMQTPTMRMPVVFKVGSSHIRVTSVSSSKVSLSSKSLTDR